MYGSDAGQPVPSLYTKGLSPLCDSSNGYGGYLACRRAEGSREGCLHQGSRKSGVLAEAELGRGGKDR